MQNIINVTNQLISHLDYLKSIFLEGKENQTKPLEFELIKQETLPIFSLIEVWEKEVSVLVSERKVNLHPAQVQATTENMEMLLMHSYFRDVRIRKYMETNKSCLYIFKQLLGGLDNERTTN